MSLLSKLARGATRAVSRNMPAITRVAGTALRSPLAKMIPGLNVVSGALMVGSAVSGVAGMIRRKQESTGAPVGMPDPERWATIQRTGVDPATGTEYSGPAGARYGVPAYLNPASAPASALVHEAGIGGIPAGLGRVGGMIGRAVPKIARGRVGRYIGEIAKIGGAWMVWTGLDWAFSDNGHKRRRSMNVMNVRALARADRRVKGFAKKARPILRELGYKFSTTRGKQPFGGKRKRCR